MNAHSIIAHVETTIRLNEDTYTALVLADFHESVQRTDDLYDTCKQWLDMYYDSVKEASHDMPISHSA